MWSSQLYTDDTFSSTNPANLAVILLAYEICTLRYILSYGITVGPSQAEKWIRVLSTTICLKIILIQPILLISQLLVIVHSLNNHAKMIMAKIRFETYGQNIIYDNQEGLPLQKSKMPIAEHPCIPLF